MKHKQVLDKKKMCMVVELFRRLLRILIVNIKVQVNYKTTILVYESVQATSQ